MKRKTRTKKKWKLKINEKKTSERKCYLLESIML